MGKLTITGATVDNIQVANNLEPQEVVDLLMRLIEIGILPINTVTKGYTFINLAVEYLYEDPKVIFCSAVNEDTNELLYHIIIEKDEELLDGICRFHNIIMDSDLKCKVIE